MEKDKKKLVSIVRADNREEVPDFYINSVKFSISTYELLLQLGLKTEPDEDPTPIVKIRMSPQHAKVMTQLLNKNIRKYEKEVGIIVLPKQLIEELGLEEEV